MREWSTMDRELLNWRRLKKTEELKSRISPKQNNWKKTIEIDRYVTETAEDKRENVPDEYFVDRWYSQSNLTFENWHLEMISDPLKFWGA